MNRASKVAIVTGAGRGIGRYSAISLAKAGYAVAVADIGPLDRVTKDLDELEADYLAITCDVRDEASVANMVQKVIERFGRIDVLHNNAGIVPHFNWGVQRWPAVKDMDKEFWDRVIGVNINGAFLCTKHVLPQMEKQGSGHIINMHGGGGGTGAVAYVMTKDALLTFTKFVAEEERAHNICVVAVSPGGAIATEDAPEDARARLPAPDSLGPAFVLAAQAPMEMSGKRVGLEGDKLVVLG